LRFAVSKSDSVSKNVKIHVTIMTLMPQSSSPLIRERKKVRVARRLRRNMTDAEKIVWGKLRNKQLENQKFRRQHPLGPYVLDLYCPAKRLVIEVDGGQHYTHKGKLRDKKREEYLTKRGLIILRYSDKDILTNLNIVLQDILNKINRL